MSYLNVYDTEAAWRLVHSLGDGPAAVVIKHANPCGVAVAHDITTAYQRAHACDPVSAYGGIVAVNRPVTVAMAEALAPVFTEVLVAPGFEADALGAPAREARTCASSRPGPRARPSLEPAGHRRWLPGADARRGHRRPSRSGRWSPRWPPPRRSGPIWCWPGRSWPRSPPTPSCWSSDGQAVGIGCGQQNRRDAGTLAGEKAGGPGRRRGVRQRRLLPVRRRARRGHRGRARPR